MSPDPILSGIPGVRFASHLDRGTSDAREGDTSSENSPFRPDPGDSASQCSIPTGSVHNLKRLSQRLHPVHSETHSHLPARTSQISESNTFILNPHQDHSLHPSLQSRSSSDVFVFPTNPHAHHRPRTRSSKSSKSHTGRRIEKERSRSGSNEDDSPTPTELRDECLIQRLYTLLDEVSKVLRAYTSTLNPSARRVQVLYAFYDRVYDLLHPPSPDPYSQRSHSKTDVRTDSDRGAEGRGINFAQVEGLEREWWDSEVVAAWYGPISPDSKQPHPHPHHIPHPFTVSSIDQPGPSRRAQGAPGTPGPEASASRRVDGVYTAGGIVGDRKGREEAIKRDASFVGLYDE